MTKEELNQEAEEFLRCTVCGDNCHDICEEPCHRAEGVKKHFLASAEPREKRIEELEEKISVLLSCKNCSENKGGYICEKEYENKCLAQKIQYIKELQKENAKLKEQIRLMNEQEARDIRTRFPC